MKDARAVLSFPSLCSCSPGRSLGTCGTCVTCATCATVLCHCPVAALTEVLLPRRVFAEGVLECGAACRSCREKQAQVALGQLLATLWGGDKECGGLVPTGCCSGLQHFPSPCVTRLGQWLHTLLGCPAVCPSRVVNRYKYIKIYIYIIFLHVHLFWSAVLAFY